MTTPSRTAIALFFLSLATTSVFSQDQKAPPACTANAFKAFRQLPKLEYECADGTNDSDDKILKLPQRRRALAGVIRALEQFNDPQWWQAGVDELNACAIHGQAGELSDEQKQKWRSGDYTIELSGNNQMRLVAVTDPCYQTGFSGSNAFLLYRKAGRIFVSQVLNGYYSRVDNSVGLEFAVLNGRQLIELTTANSMPPSYHNYYFEIDRATNKTIPWNGFREAGRPINELDSAMLMAEPADLGLPKTASELNVFRNGRLAPSFSAYEEDERGKIDSNGRKLRRIVYRWNGRYYMAGR